jgi:hypothetical protein
MERCARTLDGCGGVKQCKITLDCAFENLPRGTGEIVLRSGEIDNSIEKTDQVFPHEVVQDQRKRRKDREGVDGKTGD